MLYPTYRVDDPEDPDWPPPDGEDFFAVMLPSILAAEPRGSEMTTVLEASGMTEGMPIVGLSGKVTKAYQIQRGTRAKDGKEWSRLDFYMTDGSGEIKVSWWDPATEDNQGLVGKTCSINAVVKAGGSGLVGALVKSYNDANFISANGSCITFDQALSQVPSSTPAPTSSSPVQRSGGIGEDEYFRYLDRWVERVVSIFKAHAVPIEASAVAATVNTMSIAVQNGKITPMLMPPVTPAPAANTGGIDDDIPF